MTFRNSLKKLGLAGILAAGIFGNEASAQYPVVIYGPVPNPPVIRRSLVIVGPQVIVRPPERIMIVDPIFYPPVAAPRVESICFDLAHKMHLRFAKRDVFLDNEEKAEYIKGQISKLKTRASIYGEAIGISHDRRTTLEVLKEVMPSIEKEGYKFVFVSELAR